ncbi:hypothetical protein V8C44DRAFT_319762 [Trichoderma aethiopicum]
MAKPAPASVGSQSQTAVPFDAIEKAQGPTNPTIATGTRATTISDSLDISRATSPSPATSSTRLSSTTMSIRYPRPPKMLSGMRTFTCPCCCQSLPEEYLEENKWKKHISDDLSPYTCILRGCTAPSALYTTKADWHQHLLDEHQGYEYWVCFACEDITQFRSKEQFSRHIEVYHTWFMRSGRISQLADVCKRFTPLDISSCPLCNWPKVHGQEMEVDKAVLLDHIAKDLHAFSLRSLPWNDDCGLESELRICQSSEKVSEWLTKNDLCAETTSEKPPLEKRVHLSSYFQHNPYFADSTETGSSSSPASYASIENGLDDLKEAQGSAFFAETTGVVESEKQAPRVPQVVSDDFSHFHSRPLRRDSISMQEKQVCCGCGRLVEPWRYTDSRISFCERCRLK